MSECYELFVRGEKFLSGDKISIEIIFNNFDGVNFVGRDGYTHEQWLRQIEMVFEVDQFFIGEKIAIKSPNGRPVLESRIGASLGMLDNHKGEDNELSI